MRKIAEETLEWAKRFKERHRCHSCPFVINEADIGVGILYDCDNTCGLSAEEIAERCAAMNGY